VVVLDDGHIVEQGPHAELLARGGAYAALWRRHADGAIDTDAVLVESA